MILVSFTVSVSHSGLMQPASTRARICSAVPPEVALLMAQAASFLMSNSAVASRLTRGATRLASITACICSCQETARRKRGEEQKHVTCCTRNWNSQFALPLHLGRCP